MNSNRILIVLIAILIATTARADLRELVDEDVLRQIAEETSGEEAKRNPDIQGPMSAFGYSFMRDKYGKDRYAELRLLQFTGSHGSGGQYVYEALNLVDGERTVSEIRNWPTAELGPVPVDIVGEYLQALEEIGVVRKAGFGASHPDL